MFGDDLIQYYPLPPCPHLYDVEWFMSYGTSCSVNIAVTENSDSSQGSSDDSRLAGCEKSRVKFVSQMKHDKIPGKSELVATNPALPFLPPNKCKFMQFWHTFFRL